MKAQTRLSGAGRPDSVRLAFAVGYRIIIIANLRVKGVEYHYKSIEFFKTTVELGRLAIRERFR